MFVPTINYINNIVPATLTPNDAKRVAYVTEKYENYGEYVGTFKFENGNTDGYVFKFDGEEADLLEYVDSSTWIPEGTEINPDNFARFIWLSVDNLDDLTYDALGDLGD